MAVEFQVDYMRGEYVCVYCHRRFPCFVEKKSPFRRTMSKKLSGAANFYRHIEACANHHKGE